MKVVVSWYRTASLQTVLEDYTPSKETRMNWGILEENLVSETEFGRKWKLHDNDPKHTAQINQMVSDKNGEGACIAALERGTLVTLENWSLFAKRSGLELKHSAAKM